MGRSGWIDARILLLPLASAGCLGRGTADAWRLVPTEASPLPGLRRANAIGVGDFDRDGRNDLAVLSGGPGELLVLINRGSGRFEPSPQGVLVAGATASGLGAGDVDGDGACDLVVSHHDDFELLVLLSAGDGTFRRAATPTSTAHEGPPHSHNLALADVDGDDRLDLVQAHSERNAVVVLLGDGAGGFRAAPGSPFAAGRHPYTVIVADLDGDRALDFAVPNMDDQDVTLALGRGSGEFAAAPGSPVPAGGRGLGLAAGDVDGDGHVDLVANFDDEDELGLLLGDGSGSFRRTHETLAAPGRCYGQTVADLDRDGIADVAAPCIDAAAVAVWLGRRDGRIGRAPRTFATPGTDSQVMAVAHLDEDALLDVVTAGWDEPTLTILLGRAASGRD